MKRIESRVLLRTAGWCGEIALYVSMRVCMCVAMSMELHRLEWNTTTCLSPGLMPLHVVSNVVGPK